MPLVKRSAPSAPDSIEPQPALATVLLDLRSPEAAERRRAAHLLGSYPEAAEAICSLLATEPVNSVRESLFTALIRIGTKDVAAGLLPLLNSEDAGLRNGAIEALKSMPAAVSERIEEILTGPSDVRIFGVEILGALAHPSTSQWLTRVIETETELNVCAAAVEALAECGDPAAASALRDLLERFPDEPFLEFSVQTALARIESV